MPDTPNNPDGESGKVKLPTPIQLHVQVEVPGKPLREFNYDFQQATISFGRDPGNDIQVPLTTVSRDHARIFFEKGDYFLEDLNSTHGTNHNGRKLAQHEKKLLRDGDKISIMSFSVEFRMTNAYFLERQPGEKTEHMARRMVQEIISSVAGTEVEPTTIRIMNGVNEGHRYDFKESQTEVVLGRSPECDVIIDDHNTSRRHCLIKRTWNGFTAQDLGSKNGVIRNGAAIEGAVYIKDGDELQIGGVKVLFIDPASKILNQFGDLGEDTAMGDPSLETVDPMQADGLQEEYEEGSQDENASDEESYDEEALSGDENIEYDSEALSDDSLSAEEDGDGDSSSEIPAEDDGLAVLATSNSSAKAEVIILALGLTIFFGAVAFFFFLKL